MGKRKRRAKRSKKFAALPLVGQRTDISRSLRVGKRQIAAANEFAEGIGCGTPFREDGNFEGTRAQKRKYMQEINRRRADQGEPRFVNFDGGYGDEI
jgi:hypothetical protein